MRIKTIERVFYPTVIPLNIKTVDKIKKCVAKYPYGVTINNIMKDLEISRGTVKTYLTSLVYAKEIIEVNYNQNTKVFFSKKRN